MVYLTMLSLTAALIYFLVGFNVIRLNRQSEICRIFFVLTLSLVIWALPGAFIYLAENTVEYSFWNKISAFGWCTFEAIALYFVMTLTENRLMRHRYFRIFILLPAGIFLYMVLFLFGPNINTSPIIESVFYKGNFLYNLLYPLVSIILILRWGLKSKSRITKKQALIISVSSLISLLLTLILQTVLPAIGVLWIPSMGQVYSLVMMMGVYYAIYRYQFMSIPTALITTELFKELTGLAFLLDSQGFIIKANRQLQHLLGYKEVEVIGRHITEIVKHPDFDKVMSASETINTAVRYDELLLPARTGTMLPFKLSIRPICIRDGFQLGLLIIGEDIRLTKELFEEIEKRKLMNDRLVQSEGLFRTLLEITPIPIILTSKLTGRMIYVNAQAEELLEADKAELIDGHLTDSFKELKDKDDFYVSLITGKEIRDKELVLIKKDHSELLVLLSMISSIYQEEEVSLSCIIDITNQKKTEAMLKLNNENINKLNNELVEMNNKLFQKSSRDSLTNLYNHQYINKILEDMLLQEHNKVELCVMMLDIDFFKKVNDNYGHLTGDKVLVTVSDIIKKCIRKEDYIGRYGGEEFLVILPHTTMSEAVMIAERIRSSTEAYDYGVEGLSLTISIGVAQYAGETPNMLVNKADKLLYQAKSMGRNRFETELKAED
jgi:diguanylate cyclase (GGDEF)-like protein/PAS domain S-box-containing protein